MPSSFAVTSPYRELGDEDTQQSKSKAKCLGKLAWDKDAGSKHSYLSVSERTRQRDAQKMMQAINKALGNMAGPDRQLAAVLPCVDKLQKLVGTEDKEYIASLLCPQYKQYIDNSKKVFTRLNESCSNEARAAKIALASGLLTEFSVKAKATELLGVSRRVVNQAIKHNKSFFDAATAHDAAKALTPTPR